MQWGTDNPHADPAQQREILSAWLDGELDPAERAELERHVAQCAWCQRELAALREVRDLLRALPAPPLPRSFALPESGPLPASADLKRARREPEQPPGSVTPLAQPASVRARRQPGRGVAVARRIGNLAALFGLVVLGGSLLLGVLSARSSATDSTAGTSGTLGQQSTGRGPTSPVNQSPTVSTRQPSAHTNGDIPGPTIQLGPQDTVPLVPLVGGGLLGGGVVVLVSAGIAERRGRRRVAA